MQTAIVTASDANYLPAACCALLSCVADGKAQAELFLLAYEVTPEDIRKAEDFLKSRGASAVILRVDADRFRQYRVDGYVSASTYSRLLLPDYFDARWDRLLYVDADMRVMADLQPLISAELHGRPIGAVHDYLQYAIYGADSSRKRLGLRPDAPYFNAGIICFDWRATRDAGLMEQARDFAAQNPHLCKAHDQDALNKAFEGAWQPLDPRWNFMTVAVPDRVLRLDYSAKFQPFVAHFAGPVKPWTADFPTRYEQHRAWYRDQLRNSPWPDFAAPVGAQPRANASGPRRPTFAEWLSAQRRQLRFAYERLSRPDDVVSPGRPIRNSPAAKGSADDGNPELARLFDRMVREAAGPTAPGAR